MFTLRQYQSNLKAEIAEAWTRARSVLAVLPTGGGKTVIFSSIVHDHIGAAAVVVHRKEIVGQIAMTLAKLGVKHRVIAPDKVVRRIRRKQLCKFGKSYVDPNAQCGVVSVQTLTSRGASSNRLLQQWVSQVTLAVYDECFTAGTLVDGVPIGQIKNGDYVTAFDENTGVFEKRKVTRLFKNHAPKKMVSVAFAGHQLLNCTRGHPFWTKRGWVPAGKLTVDDQVLIYGDVQHVREESRPIRAPEKQIRKDGTGVLQSGVFTSIPVQNGIVGHDEHKSEVRQCPDEKQQPYAEPRNASKSLGNFEAHSALSGSARRERQVCDESRTKISGVVRPVGVRQSGDCFNRKGQSSEEVTHSLQNRLRERPFESSRRGGRVEPQYFSAERTRSPKRQISEWVRVESVSILKRRDLEQQPGSFFDGYVYNIEVEGLHTYTANGVTVHNCHHYVDSGLWARAVECMKNAKLLGVTATPERADGKGLGSDADGFADEMVQGPTSAWLMAEGHLCKYRYFAPTTDLDVQGLAVTASGDFNATALRARVVESHLVGDCVAHYRKFAHNKRAIVFADSVATAEEMAEGFRQAGYTSQALNGATEQGERDRTLNQFENGDVQVLVNVDLFDEGFDVPAVECVLLARPTQSLGKFLQMIGRGLRIMPGKEYAVIIDAVRNWERHGMPDWPRAWTLNGREKRSGSTGSDLIPQRVCTGCTQPYEKFLKACPYCGHVEVPAGRSSPEQVDGDLAELDVAALSALFDKMNAADMSDDDFRDRQVSRHVPAIGRAAGLRRHQAAKHRRQVLRELVGWWVGAQDGRELPEVHKRFYHRFGIDIGTAFTLSGADTDALIGRITEGFTEDMIL